MVPQQPAAAQLQQQLGLGTAPTAAVVVLLQGMLRCGCGSWSFPRCWGCGC
jgi:hypothetical protein